MLLDTTIGNVKNGTRKKTCRKCKFEGGVLNEEGLCNGCVPDECEPGPCGTCKRPVRGKDRGLECEVCENWFHVGCEKVTKEQYEFLMDEENKTIPWICRKCKGNLKHYAKKVDRLEREKEELKDRLEKLEENSLLMKNEIKDEVINVVFEELEEWKEKEEKKNNVIVFNLQEKVCETKEEKHQEDLSLSVQVIKEIGLDIDKEEIKEVHRIGKMQSSQEERGEECNRRPRPLLIKLNDTRVKWEIVRNGKRIKETGKEHLKRAIIVPDQTKKERERNKKLRDELKERRDNGEEGWFIRKGQLARRAFL